MAAGRGRSSSSRSTVPSRNCRVFTVAGGVMKAGFFGFGNIELFFPIPEEVQSQGKNDGQHTASYRGSNHVTYFHV